MDVDAAGLPFLKNMDPPAGGKSVEDLKAIAEMAGAPFIVKGVMTVKGALKAKEAGAAAIVVSNHGGRVQDQCPATAEVLPEIVKAVGGSMKIFVDGGIRSGVDIFQGTGTWCRCSYYRPSFCNSCLWRCRRRRESLH